MTGKRLVVELFYDVVSPYTYFGFEALCRYREPWNMELKLKPVLLAAVMRETGNQSPAVVLNKAIYGVEDLYRLSRYYKIPFGLHEDYIQLVLTKNTLQAQRFLSALDLFHPEYLEVASRQFFRRFFGEQKEIMSIECIAEVSSAAKIPKEVMDKCLSALSSSPVKELLKKNTDEAIQLGAFGSPTFVASIDGRKEMYFGQDRLVILANDAGKPWLGPNPQTLSKM